MAIKFSLKNITQILKGGLGEVVFNPALVFLRNNLFLCAFRAYKRYKELDTSKYEDDPFTNPNHPWLGGMYSELWWKSPKGYDETKIVLLEFTHNKLKIIRDYGTFQGQDMRLFRYDENTFLMTGNVFLQTPKITLKDNKTCKDNSCALISVRVLKIDKKFGITFYPGKILCPQKSETIEKNWTLWKSSENNKLYISYNIIPVHEVFELELTKTKVVCPSIQSIKSQKSVLEKLYEYYNGIVNISLSTPSLPFGNNLVAFGHIKYKYKEIDKIDKNSNLYKFQELLKSENKKFHPLYVYMFYIYEFSSSSPYNILRVSNMFIPDSKFALVFANNLTFHPKTKKYILSYGDHDNECWLLSITGEEIEKALKVVDDPSKIEFLLIDN